MGTFCIGRNCQNSIANLEKWSNQNCTSCNISGLKHKACGCPPPYQLHSFPMIGHAISLEWSRILGYNVKTISGRTTICSEHFFEIIESWRPDLFKDSEEETVKAVSAVIQPKSVTGSITEVESNRDSLMEQQIYGITGEQNIFENSESQTNSPTHNQSIDDIILSDNISMETDGFSQAMKEELENSYQEEFPVSRLKIPEKAAQEDKSVGRNGNEASPAYLIRGGISVSFHESSDAPDQDEKPPCLFLQSKATNRKSENLSANETLASYNELIDSPDKAKNSKYEALQSKVFAKNQSSTKNPISDGDSASSPQELLGASEQDKHSNSRNERSGIFTENQSNKVGHAIDHIYSVPAANSAKILLEMRKSAFSVKENNFEAEIEHPDTRNNIPMPNLLASNLQFSMDTGESPPDIKQEIEDPFLDEYSVNAENAKTIQEENSVKRKTKRGETNGNNLMRRLPDQLLVRLGLDGPKSSVAFEENSVNNRVKKSKSQGKPMSKKISLKDLRTKIFNEESTCDRKSVNKSNIQGNPMRRKASLEALRLKLKAKLEHQAELNVKDMKKRHKNSPIRKDLNPEISGSEANTTSNETSSDSKEGTQRKAQTRSLQESGDASIYSLFLKVEELKKIRMKQKLEELNKQRDKEIEQICGEEVKNVLAEALKTWSHGSRFDCPICGLSLAVETEKKIARHFKSVHSKMSEKCQNCGKRMSTVAKKNHVCRNNWSKVTVKGKQYEMDPFSKMDENVATAAKPQAQLGRTYFLCAKCGKRMRCRKLSTNHALSCRLAEEGIRFLCPDPDCDEFFVEFNQLRNHYPIHVSSPTGQCPICQKQFTKPDLRYFHMLKEHDPEAYEKQSTLICDICNKKFPSEEKLMRCLSKHAAREKKQQSEKNIDHECKICGNSFSNYHKLTLHIRKAHVVKIKCGTCKQEYHPDRLQSHVEKMHGSPTESITCSLCDMKFAQEGSLRIHLIKKHKDNDEAGLLQKTDTCGICKKVFSSATSLKTHNRFFHEKIGHTCQFCGKLTSTPYILKLHEPVCALNPDSPRSQKKMQKMKNMLSPL